jgi:hypothetical protein
MQKFSQTLGNVSKDFKDYWRVYGGCYAIIRSPYVHVSLVLTVIMSPLWLQPSWWERPLSVLPNLLGFTLGGMAVLTGWGNRKFAAILKGSDADGRASPYIESIATFVHFLIMQFLAIILALLASSRPLSNISSDNWGYLCERIIFISQIRLYGGYFFWFLGFFVFIYAVVLTISAIMGLFVFERISDDVSDE